MSINDMKNSVLNHIKKRWNMWNNNLKDSYGANSVATSFIVIRSIKLCLNRIRREKMNRIFILTTIFVFMTIFVESTNLFLQLKGRRLIYNHYNSPYNAGE